MKGKTSGKHLTQAGRKFIEENYKHMKKEEIAERLGIHIATLNRELNRCKRGAYSAREAQADYEFKTSGRYLGKFCNSSKDTNLHEKKEILAYIHVNPDTTVRAAIPVGTLEPEFSEHITKI